MTSEELKSLIAEYVATLDDTEDEESYMTTRAHARVELNAFVTWLEQREGSPQI